MRQPLERLLGERFEREASRTLLTIAPLFFLSVFSLLVRNADSSNAFRLDQQWVLERLKREVVREEELARVSQMPAVEEPGDPSTIELLPAEIREVHEVVRRGDTFGGILKRLGIDSGEVTRWSAAAREYASLAELSPGNSFTFLLPSGTARLAGLQYELGIDSALVMREVGDEIDAAVERLPSTVDVLAVGGEIQTTLYGAAVEAGVPDEIVSQVVDVFGWEVDFDSLQPGDTFRIAYEEQRGPSGKRIGGRLLAAELTSGGKAMQAFHFQLADGSGKYYTAEGRPYGRAFLRYPVEFSRITSQFSASRFHPILRVRRPHYGVDFAAAAGTPVRSIGAGTVVSAGMNGGHGRFVKIRHGGGIESSYSHLRSIGRGIRRGVRVEMGDVIGSVGASGLATGAHLHFAMWKNGAYVDPNGVKLPIAPVISNRHRGAFEDARDMLLTQLAEAKIQSKPIVTVLATSPSNGG